MKHYANWGLYWNDWAIGVGVRYYVVSIIAPANHWQIGVRVGPLALTLGVARAI